MSSNRGVWRASKRDITEVLEGRKERLTSIAYGKSDGMASRECNGGIQPAVWRTPDGRLWFPTTKGLSVVDPAHLEHNTAPPPVVIEGLSADGRPAGIHEGAEVRAGRHRIEFRFAALSLAAPEKVQVRYKLEGFDRDWIDAGTRRVADYTSIPPGSYRFRVIAANNDGVWNTTGASVPFRVLPRFYQTPFFYFLCLTATAALGAGLHSIRARMRQQRELAVLVAERTRELREEKGRAEQALRQAEEAKDRLAQSEARFRGLIQNSSDVVTVLSGDGTIRYVSPSVQKVLGCVPASFEGQPLSDLVHESDRESLRNLVALVAGLDSPPAPVQFRLKSAEGRWRAFEALVSDMRSEPAVQGLVLNARDITDRKELEEQLRQSQKMEAFGQLAGGVAHDFNNLLSVIVGYCSLLAEALVPASEAMQEVDEIHKAADRATALTRQMLAFSRRQILEPRIINLNSTVESVEKMLGRLIGEDIELAFRKGRGLRNVRVDPGQLEQVIMNLAVNARDAMPSGGTLKIETSGVDADGNEQISGTDSASHVALTVSDTGCGMDSATLSRVFEPFFTTKDPGKGTGLGLSTVYGIVVQSGGTIKVSSEPGKGSTFKCVFPAAAAEEAREERSVERAAGDLTGKETILLVEDEPDLRRLARRLLEAQGYRVLEALDGAAAVALCDGREGEIELLLTDVVLPKMGGRQLADRVRAACPHAKVLFTSGYTDNAVLRHGVIAEEINFLQKPYSPQALLRKVREMLDG